MRPPGPTPADVARRSAPGDRWLRLATLLLLAGGAVVIALVWQIGRSVTQTTETLVRHDLPLAASLYDLKIAVQREEPILYEYYATADQERFQDAHRQNWTRVVVGMAQLDEGFPGSAEMVRVRQEAATVEKLAGELDRIMSSPRIDWDAARATLVDVSAHATEANAALDRLVATLRDTTAARGDHTHRRVGQVTALVGAFAIATVLLLFAAGYLLGRSRREAHEKRQLALFPERNPNPILSVTLEGQLVYANPGSQRMLATLPGSSSRLDSLLPPDLQDQLAVLASGGADVRRFEYQIHDRNIACEIHPVSGQPLAHVYLLDVTERRRVEQRLRYQAFHDPLTSLPNRYRLDDRLTACMVEGCPVDLWLVSVDRFRLFVDGFTRRTVDELLSETARRLASGLSRSGRPVGELELFRLDGAQFAVLDLQPGPDLEAVPELLSAALSDPVTVQTRELLLTLSLGGASAPRDGADADTLYRRADRALQAMRKSGGAGRLRWHEELDAQLVERLELETALRRALERGELSVHYQPQVSATDGAVVGFEALLRWRHPVHGMVSPATFIPLAEETGLIGEIGAWVLEAACARARAWHDAGLRDFTMGVNISARQFAGADLVGLVQGVLARTGLPPECLDLEITESIALHDVRGTIDTLHALKSMGVRLSIDDFGTGYSSLAYLKGFPVDRLKIDRSFVSSIDADSASAALVRGVIALVRALGLKAIAEGVETEAQRRILREFGCDEIQGYLVSPPRPPGELGDFLPAGAANAAPAAGTAATNTIPTAAWDRRGAPSTMEESA